jgi:ABC-type Fe3+-hydroxamate transport system substrate-binding protein
MSPDFSSVDQLGRTIHLNGFPKKIISLVPSQSELLWDLGLQKELVGITKFCIHPEEMFQTVSRVGGTKNIDHAKVEKLNPDLIIANKEENTKEDIDALTENYNVWISDINNLSDAKKMIAEIGRITDKQNEANLILDKISFPPTNKERKKIIYLIWNEPMMCAGKNTFIDEMIHLAGFENCITANRYPEITFEEIQKIKPDYLFLSTEPFPFGEKHVGLFDQKIKPVKSVLVDGEMFSWYGSRLILAKDYFCSLREMVGE